MNRQGLWINLMAENGGVMPYPQSYPHYPQPWGQTYPPIKMIFAKQWDTNGVDQIE